MRGSPRSCVAKANLWTEFAVFDRYAMGTNGKECKNPIIPWWLTHYCLHFGWVRYIRGVFNSSLSRDVTVGTAAYPLRGNQCYSLLLL